MLHRLTGNASEILPDLEARFDLIVTSPPAWPSPKQGEGALGTESSLYEYIHHFGTVLKLCRRVLDKLGYLALVLQPQETELMERLSRLMPLLKYRLLATFRWDHGNGQFSWVVFFSQSERARLNTSHPAAKSPVWAIPVREADPEYGFWEWPDGLVEAIVGLTIPQGGRVLDPFCGKAQALQSLPEKFDVWGIDVV